VRPIITWASLPKKASAADEALAYYRQVGPGEHYLPAQLRSAGILANQLRQAGRGARQLRAAGNKEPAVARPTIDRRSRLLRDAKQTEAALALLDQALSSNRSSPSCSMNRRCWPRSSDAMEIMESRLRKLIELQPENAQAYNALGYSYADRNMRLPEARQLIEKALQLAPNDPFILDSMAWVLYRQGDLEGALALLQRAYALRPDPEIAAHLGEVLWMLGRKDEAQRTLREAQKKDPANEVLKEAIRRFSP
jgi:tetratricopeptide (TPR) repeat protein